MNIPQQKRILHILGKIWETKGDLRFFQLLFALKVLELKEGSSLVWHMKDPFAMPDDELEEKLTKYLKENSKELPDWIKNPKPLPMRGKL